MTPYVGLYYSKNFIRKNILKLTEQEVDQIETENKQDPAEVMPGAPGSMQAAAPADANPDAVQQLQRW